MITAWTPPLLDLGSGGTERWNEALTFSGEPIALKAKGAELAFRPTDPPASHAPVAVLSVQGFSHPLLAHIREFSFAKACNVQLSIEGLDVLPQGLREALYEGMIAHCCEAAGETDRDRWHLRKVQPLERIDPLADPQWFEIVMLHKGKPWVNLDLCVSRADALQLIDTHADQPTPTRMIIGEGVRVPTDFTIGTLILTYRELRSLQPGAIVVMAKREPDICELRVENTLYSFVASDDEWCCVGVEFVPGTFDEGQLATWEAAAMVEKSKDRSRKEGLRLTLVFEIGRQSISLSELSRWREGALIDLDPVGITEGMEVTIRAQGSIVGSGDLVKIDDRIAVRITRLIL
jgi:flagellar motor switch/type III secretory pathway protein FliN